VGRADSLDRQKKLEARKMLEKPHRTHPSSARFVGLRLPMIIFVHREHILFLKTCIPALQEFYQCHLFQNKKFLFCNNDYRH
jgi:hypothetical protein